MAARKGQAIVLSALTSALAVFAFGFLFGIIRIFVLIPRTGPLIGVLIELPFMLAVSFFVWKYMLWRFAVPAEPSSRLIAGLFAFAFLMLMEFALSTWITGSGPGQFLAAIDNPAGVLGLVGQLAFGLMPLLI